MGRRFQFYPRSTKKDFLLKRNRNRKLSILSKINRPKTLRGEETPSRDPFNSIQDQLLCNRCHLWCSRELSILSKINIIREALMRYIQKTFNSIQDQLMNNSSFTASMTNFQFYPRSTQGTRELLAEALARLSILSKINSWCLP